MNSRERVHAVLNRQMPDAVPHGLYDVAIDSFNADTIALFQERCGKHPRDCFHHDLRGLKVVEPFKRDPDVYRAIRDIQSVDDVRSAMARWQPPAPDVAALRRRVDVLHAAGYPAVAVGLVSDFETPFGLRGREQFFCDLGYQDEWLPAFLDAITDAAVEQARAAVRAGADIFGIGDDLGSQRGLLISPAQWREWFKPRLRRIVQAVKQPDSHTAFFLHTDGQVGEVIPDFIDVGVDILNPIQPEVLDPAEVKRLYGRALIFFGAVSVQHTLPLGTPEQVAAEVKLRMETIGAGGGYFMTPSHLLNRDIPWENIAAYFDAAEQYGRYQQRG